MQKLQKWRPACLEPPPRSGGAMPSPHCLIARPSPFRPAVHRRFGQPLSHRRRCRRGLTLLCACAFRYFAVKESMMPKRKPKSRKKNWNQIVSRVSFGHFFLPRPPNPPKIAVRLRPAVNQTARSSRPRRPHRVR